VHDGVTNLLIHLRKDIMWFVWRGNAELWVISDVAYWDPVCSASYPNSDDWRLIRAIFALSASTEWSVAAERQETYDDSG
jgi:hypothetical protein